MKNRKAQIDIISSRLSILIDGIKEFPTFPHKDIDELAQIQDEIKNLNVYDEDKFIDLIQFAPDAFFQGDGKGDFILVNKAAENLTGYSNDELLKMNMEDLFPKEILDQKPLRYDLLEKNQVVISERQIRRKDGELVFIEMNSSKMNDGTFQSFMRNISTRKTSEMALKESEERFRTLAKSTSTAIFVYRGEKFVYANSATEKLTGYSSDELIEMNFWDVVHHDFKNLIRERGLARQRGEVVSNRYEFKIIAKSGEEIWVDFTAGAISWLGKPAAIGSAFDISERKKAEKLLLESRERYKLISDLTSDYLFETRIEKDGTWTPVWVAGSFEKITGFTLDEYNKRGGWIQHLHPDDLEIDSKARQKILNNQRADVVLRSLNSDGNYAWVKSSASPIWDENEKRVSAIIGAVKDVTQEIEGENILNIQYNIAHAAVRTNTLNEFLSIVREQLGGMINTKNFFIAFYNEETGIMTSDLAKDEMDDIPSWKAEKSLSGIVLKRKKSQLFYEYEINELLASKVIGGNGTVPKVWLGVPIKIGKKAIGIMVVQSYSNKNEFSSNSMDLMEIIANQLSLYIERKNAIEDTIKLSKAVIQSPVIIVITDRNGNITYVNPKFTEVTGYSFEEVKGKKTSLLNSGYHTEDFYKKLWDTILSGEDWHGEFKNKKKNGEIYWENASIASISNEKGEITNFVAAKEDITEKKKMIGELIEAKELAESSEKIKTEFLAQMSHEIRSPLNVVLNAIALLKEEFDEIDSEIAEFSFSSISSASKRIIRTIDLILNMTDLQSGLYETIITEFDLISLLEVLTAEYRHSAKIRDLKLLLTVNIRKGLIYSDEFAVSQIIGNLIDNAIKYTKKGYVEVIVERDKSRNVVVSVKDTGIGIAKKFIPNLFSAFTQEEQGYTRSYDGNGLGLALVKNYCSLIGAEINVESRKNSGSKFSVTLPSQKLK